MTFRNRTLAAVRWLGRRVSWTSDRGASAVEYGFLASLIAATIIIAVVMLGQQTTTNFQCTADTIVTRTTQC